MIWKFKSDNLKLDRSKDPHNLKICKTSYIWALYGLTWFPYAYSSTADIWSVGLFSYIIETKNSKECTVILISVILVPSTVKAFLIHHLSDPYKWLVIHDHAMHLVSIQSRNSVMVYNFA